ncbi:hypothetical protein ACWGR4_30185 [Embleya sp. NPDC055664]
MFLALVLIGAALVAVVGLLVSAATAKLARLAGASRPLALTRSAAAFGATVTLAATVTAALAALAAATR